MGILSRLARQPAARKLVYASKGRWLVERDYEELKDIELERLRGARVARLSSSPDAVHRGLRVSGSGVSLRLEQQVRAFALTLTR